jgi:benzil reductase ((S)-benzoin forming)
MQTVLITGVGSGLGKALAQPYLDRGDKVYAIGREAPKVFDHHPHFFFFPYDLSETFTLQSSVREFIQHHHFDLVVLNAGVLGEIRPLIQTDLEELKQVMEVNVWANKELIDALAKYSDVTQVVGISSGAAVNGSKGWGAYALSKAALNMLLKVYARELPNIHFTALAPGVIKTPMVDYILEEVDTHEYPSVARLKNGPIQTPKEAATLLIDTFPKLLKYESGSFIDVRTMDQVTP